MKKHWKKHWKSKFKIPEVEKAEEAWRKKSYEVERNLSCSKKRFLCYSDLNPLRANASKWSNTLRQFFGNSRKSVFDYFVGLVLKGLKNKIKTNDFSHLVTKIKFLFRYFSKDKKINNSVVSKLFPIPRNSLPTMSII